MSYYEDEVNRLCDESRTRIHGGIDKAANEFAARVSKRAIKFAHTMFLVGVLVGSVVSLAIYLILTQLQHKGSCP